MRELLAVLIVLVFFLGQIVNFKIQGGLIDIKYIKSLIDGLNEMLLKPSDNKRTLKFL